LAAESPLPARRPIIQATSPERYRVQFTIGKESHDKLRRLQTLLRREIPDGDPGTIIDRALSLLLEKVEKTKLGRAAGPQRRRLIRPGTDTDGREGRLRSRHMPPAIKDAVSRRDADQCAFVSPAGERCTERTFLEFHHIKPYAKGGPATVENISLRCRRHNQYEAELVFGPHGTSEVREAHTGAILQPPVRRIDGATAPSPSWPRPPDPSGARWSPWMTADGGTTRSPR
jgi:hypothetical protein